MKQIYLFSLTICFIILARLTLSNAAEVSEMKFRGEAERTLRRESSNNKAKRCWSMIEGRVNSTLSEQKRLTYKPNKLRALRHLRITKRRVSTNLLARKRLRNRTR